MDDNEIIISKTEITNPVTIKEDRIILNHANKEIKRPKHTVVDKQIIGEIEKLSRISLVYPKFISFLKNNLDVKKCAFHSGFSIDFGHTLEFHHEPLTLYDISEIIARKMLKEEKDVKTILCARDTMLNHFLFRVGLTPLNPTAHELVHSGELECPDKIIIGGYDKFLDKYKEYIPERVKDKMKHFEEFSKEYDKNPKYPKILRHLPVVTSDEYIKIENTLVNMILDAKIEHIT